MSNNSESFVFYKSFLDAIELLPEEEQLKAFKLIAHYGANDELPEGEQTLANAIFMIAKPNIDANKIKRDNGKKGGRPSKDAEKENEKPPVIEEETNGYENEKPPVIEEENHRFSKSKSNVNVNVNDNVNVNVNENDNNIKTSCAIPCGNAHDLDAKTDTKKDLQEQRFNEFWSIYPKKVGKEAAKKAWKKAKPDKDLFDKMIKAINTAKTSEQWRKNNGQFIPNPATWLNQGRWDDELEEVSAAIAEANKGDGKHDESIKTPGGKWGFIGTWY